MDIDSSPVQLCIQGTQAEFDGKPDEAHALYVQAWEAAQDDFDACVAAHYVARFQQCLEDVLRWNREALARADAVGDERVREFYPSLYLNMGRSYELLGNESEAARYYGLAAALGVMHQSDAGPGVLRR
jgi:hypothetical protein